MSEEHMKPKGNLSTLAMVLLLALLFNYYTYVNSEVSYRIADSPDENLALIFSKLIAEDSSLIWHSEMNERYNVSYFRPRNSIDIGDNNYIGPYAGFQMLLATARLYGLIDHIVALTGCIGVLFLYLLVRNIFDERTAIIAALLWGLNPSYVFFSNMYYSNIPAVTFSIIALYCFHKGVQTEKITYIGCSGLFCLYAVFTRTSEIVIFASILIGLLAARWGFTKKIQLKETVIFVSIFLVLRILWTASSSSLNAQTVDINTGGGGIGYQFGYLMDNIGFYGSSFMDYIISYPPLLFVLACFGVISIYSSKDKMQRFFTLFFIILFLLFFGLYGFRGETWGFENVSIDSSMARYFLINYAILSIFASVFLVNFFKKQDHSRIVALFLLLILLTSTAMIFESDNNLIRAKDRLSSWSDLNRETVDVTPKNAVIFTRAFDKVFMLDRQVAVYRTEEELRAQPDMAYWYTPANMEKDLIPLIDKMISDGIPVYVTQEATELFQHLEKNNRYRMTPVTKNKMIWKIDKIS
ncbi:ArnT family glycosyltransferase [Methanomethylovorans sp.]|uniref:ArnT family glycosyltransferase n=1 Tax=Methanomethylovorans sp. TaxID=2758717 RepID=UPI00345E27BA